MQILQIKTWQKDNWLKILKVKKLILNKFVLINKNYKQ